MACKLHQVTDDCAYPASADFLPSWVITLFQRFLAYNSQDIISNDCKFKHKLVAVKFSRWKSFHIHICLYLAVVLLTFAVCVVKIYNVLV